MKFVKNYRTIVIVICILLSVLPFIWLKPGEIDMGGDSNRLFFYDPANFLWNNGLYYVLPWGTGIVESYLFYFPFVVFLFIVKSIVQSPHVVTCLLSASKLVFGFLSVYGILKILIDREDNHQYSSKLVEFSTILGGFFYIFSSFLIKNDNWVTPINSHAEIFLNPLIFYLVLRFFLSNRYGFLLLALFISFIFSPNFAWGAVYSFAAFYPLAMIFLILYVLNIAKKRLPLKGILIGLLLFIGLQGFHLIPAVFDLLTSSTDLNARVFSKENIAEQITSFQGLLSFAKASENMLSVSPLKELAWASVLTPIIVISGFLFNRTRKKTILLTGIFFLITFFLLTANFTQIGIKFYETLFLYIPGFTMFKDFIYVWKFVFAFFYALLFGQALFLVFSQLKKRYVSVLFCGLLLFITLSAWPFINGDLVTKGQFTTHVKSGIVIDPQFENVLSFLRSQKEDTKILSLPFSDYDIQTISGSNGAWYLGTSIIATLGGKKDFTGYKTILPFSEAFLRAAKNKDYQSIKRLLGILNIHYVFFYNNPDLFNAGFYNWLYSYVSGYLPRDQNEYNAFIEQLANREVFKQGSYELYVIDDKVYLPHFYIAKGISMYEDNPNDKAEKRFSFFVDGKNDDIRTVFLDKNTCIKYFSSKECDSQGIQTQNVPKIQFEKINPTKYKVKVSNAQKPYLLVFSEAFYDKWQVFLAPTSSLQNTVPLRTYFNGDIKENTSKNIFFDDKTFETLGMEKIPDNRHMLINGYANAWYIRPEDVGSRGEYELIIEMVGQRIFYISLGVSLLTFIFCIGWGIKLIVNRMSMYGKK